MAVRHFLTLLDLTKQELYDLIDNAIKMKAQHKQGVSVPAQSGRVLGMIFEKSSTRTRISFEVGINQLGGSSLFLSQRDTQLGRGEPIEDSARVMSRMLDIIMIRTYEHEKITKFAQYSSVPVINALTDSYHPCQLLADLQTYNEHRGNIQGRTVAWIGDGNNMCHSYINAARQWDFELRIACPKGFEPDAELVAANADRVQIVSDPQAAVAGASLVSTDTWASMGQETEKHEREQAFANYQVNEELMTHAEPKALFMHCLPAYRGLEISETMLDADCSVVWDQAENRLHAQKALMAFLLDHQK